AFNGLMFALATFSAQGMLRRTYCPLIARHPRHRAMLRVWLVTFAFVGLQMAWVLRPFVGDPSRPVEFFRDEAWANAYLVVIDLLRQLLARAAGWE
ncbi:MAG: hypothetical protein ACKV0T_28045, partial [Planctomycetales bacterium]